MSNVLPVNVENNTDVPSDTSIHGNTFLIGNDLSKQYTFSFVWTFLIISNNYTFAGFKVLKIWSFTYR